MSLLGKQIQLKGITQKGKNRIRENNNQWVVLAETDRVVFAPNQAGPWLFVAPLGKNQNDKGARWIRASGDENFSMEVLD